MIGNLLDFIWPRACAVCERPVDRPGRYLCTDCLNRLPLIPADGLCRRCGCDATALDGEFLCEECREKKTRPEFDRAGSAIRFDGEARELVNSFKFRSGYYLRNDLVDLLEAMVRTRFRLEEIDLVAPVPSTFAHRFLRGYNQCHYLAKELSRRLKLKYDAHLLKRVGHPLRQGLLTREDRRENVIGTFAAAHRVKKGATVLVVDDIMTTGATLSECAKVLKAAGAARVFAASLARPYRV